MKEEITHNEHWLSAHIYYQTSVFDVKFDRFIRDGIHKFVEICLEHKWIENFFFIRYAEHGPHVRLRLKLTTAKLELIVKTKLESFMSHFFKENPESNDLALIFERLPQVVPEMWHNYSIHYIPYERELARFGGVEGIKIIEDHFKDSTIIVFTSLTTLDSTDLSIKYGLTFQMLMVLVNTFCLSTDEMSLFASNNTRALLDAELGHVSESLWEKEQQFFQFLSGEYKTLETPQPIKAMYQAYEEHSNQFFQQNFKNYQLFWDRILNQQPLGSPLLEQWRSALLKTKQQLEQSAHKGILKVSNFCELPPQQQILAIVASMSHLHNNRMGLHLIEEAWLWFLFHKFLNNSDQIVAQKISQEQLCTPL